MSKLVTMSSTSFANDLEAASACSDICFMPDFRLFHISIAVGEPAKGPSSDNW